MLKRILLTGPLAVVVLACSLQAHADTITYTAIMSGSNEVPPTGSPATGLTTLSLTGDLLTVSVTWSGLIGGNPAAAHIHCCIAPGSNAPVAIPFTNFPPTTSGTYTNTFDLSLLATYNGAFVTAVGGTVAAAEAALKTGLGDYQAYSNIHNATFPGGEIRGIIVATPEPGTFLLLGTGLAGIAGALRRRLLA